MVWESNSDTDMKIPTLLSTLIASLAISAAATAGEQAPNSLSDKEKADGWKLLFDGKNTDQWKSFKVDTFPSKGWKVDEGWLVKIGGERGGNLLTKEEFTDFEFSWEWRMAEGGNNGVKYFVDESRGNIGHEYQMLAQPGKKPTNSYTGSFYAVAAPTGKIDIKLPPETNHSRIVVKGDNVQHWLNGILVLEYVCGSKEILDGVANSKFKKDRDFGKKLTARIMLTDHGSECAFRNLKIRELK